MLLSHEFLQIGHGRAHAIKSAATSPGDGTRTQKPKSQKDRLVEKELALKLPEIKVRITREDAVFVGLKADGNRFPGIF